MMAVKTTGMSLSGGAAAFATFALAALCAFGDNPPPCNPQPVVKPVKVVRREIKVAIIGEERMFKPKDLKWNVQEVIDYWYEAMDREIGNKPDLVVLPEGIDNWRDVTPAEKREWEKVRGDRIFRAMQDYAKKHRCYLVFNSPRQFPDGRFANTTWTLDRDGDLIASYDKAFPTPREMEWKEFKTVPGSKAVVCDTDFGRLGFVTCFDLNFTHFADEYRPLAPDMMVFCSYYDGNYMRNYWASRTQAYLIGCTVGGSLPKTVVGPSGEELLYFPEGRIGHRKTITVTVNTNFRVIHYDDNKPKLAAALKKYGTRLYITDPTRAGTFTLYSADPALPVDDVVKEFGMETWHEYYDRTLKLKSAIH